jgi:hypothetical protein
MSDRDDAPSRGGPPGGSGGEDPPARPAERDRVVEALCEHYARDRLELDEFERRVERAHRARTRDELRALVADLPELGTGPGRTVASSSGGEGAPGRPDPGSALGPARSGGLEWPGQGAPSPVQAPERQTEIAIWSGRVRKGAWVPARTIRAFGFMGGVELDFREALFSGDPIHIHAGAFMGGVEIIVPPGVRVETDGFAFMGGFEEDTEPGTAPAAGAPLIRVTGFAFMGGVEITSRHPGENARQARRRRKEEARRRLSDGSG